MNGIPGRGLRVSRLRLTEAGLAVTTGDREWDRPPPESMIVNHTPNFILLEAAFQTGWSTRV